MVQMIMTFPEEKDGFSLSTLFEKQNYSSSFSHLSLPHPLTFLYLRPVDYLGECLTPLGHDFRVGLICDRPKDKTQDFPSRSSVPSDRSKDSHCQG